MRRKEGFTLIELMIVVAIIAIIAAIAIPNLITSKIAAQETAALVGLRMLVSVEATWQQSDPDGSGKDYWTYDVSCFYRIRPASPFIPVDFASADEGYCAYDASTVFGDKPVLADFPVTAPATATAKSGYLFQALDLDTAGTAYNQVAVGTLGVAAANKNQFGFIAAPDIWNSTGVRIFIVNQSGTVFACNPGSSGDKWKTTTTYDLRWPAANPNGVAGPGGAGMNWVIGD